MLSYFPSYNALVNQVAALSYSNLNFANMRFPAELVASK